MVRLACTIALSMALIFGACSSSPRDDGTVRLTILHTNDVHGHLWPEKRKDGLMRGGAAAFAFQVKKIRKEVQEEGGATLLLSAGDVNTGVPDSDYFFAEPDFRIMDFLGYDALALGNHEFDNGVEKIHQQRSWVKFPFLSANIFPKNSGKTFAEPYIILERNGVKIGILGLTTDGLQSLVPKKNTESVEITSPLDAAQKYIPEMRRRGVQLIIALTHLGISKVDKKPISMTNDDLALANAGLGIHIIVGGHSHALLPNGIREGETLIAQSGEYGEFFGKIDIDWHKSEARIARSSANIRRIDPADGQDPETQLILKPYEETARGIFDKAIGRTQVLLEGQTEKVRYRETNLGNLICDVMKEKTGADIAVLNGGAIRGSIAEGKITLRDVLKAFPFKNTIVSTKLSGKQLRHLIQSGVRNRRKFGGSFLQVSGIQYSIKGDALVDLKVNGKKVKNSDQFTLATSSFVITGGDKLDISVEPNHIKDTGILVYDALIEHLQAFRSVNPQEEGRITTLD